MEDSFVSVADPVDAATLAISARGLTRSFGDVKAVAGIDLEVPRGMIFAVLGPNGAGKTTLMRMLATLLRPDAGAATVMGHDLVTAPRLVRASIAMTGQFASLDEDLTGRENLVLIARLWGFSGRAGRRRRRRAAGGVRAERGGRAAGQGLFGRHAAAARHRGLADRDAGRAVPRRADHRARPDRAPGGLAHDPAAGAGGRHDPPDHAVPRRGGPARRPYRGDRPRAEDRRGHQP